MSIGFQPAKTGFEFNDPTTGKSGGADRTSFSLENLLSSLTGGGGSKGLFGLGDVATGSLLGLGKGLFSSLGDLFGGKSEGEKNLSSVFKQLQNQLGQTQLDPDQFMAQFFRENKERFDLADESQAKRTGMDSFLTHAANANRREKSALTERGRLAQLAPQLQSQHDLSILRQLAGVASAQG